MQKKVWMCIWLAGGLYFVIAAIGADAGMNAAMAMLCGFMSARNAADVVAT